MLAVSVDEPAQSRALVARVGLPFRSLCDVSRDVVRRYGLLHPSGGPGGSDIAIPALLLVRPDGTIAWRMHEARSRLHTAMNPDTVRKRRPLSQELEGLLSELGLPVLSPGRA